MMWIFIIGVPVLVFIIALGLVRNADHSDNCPYCGGETEFLEKAEDGQNLLRCRKCGKIFRVERRD